MAKPKAGTTQVNVELPGEFLDEVKEFAEKRGEKVREVVYHALRRHLAYPPPPPVLPTEPLPDSLAVAGQPSAPSGEAAQGATAKPRKRSAKK